MSDSSHREAGAASGRRRHAFVMILLGLALSLGGCYEAGEGGDGGAGTDTGPDASTDSDTAIDTDTGTGADTDTGTDTCADMGMYGPPPCTSDEECAEEYGDGWWCDEDYVVEYEGCELVWPTCVPDASYYGPAGIPPDGAGGEEPAGEWYGGERGAS